LQTRKNSPPQKKKSPEGFRFSSLLLKNNKYPIKSARTKIICTSLTSAAFYNISDIEIEAEKNILLKLLVIFIENRFIDQTGISCFKYLANDVSQWNQHYIPSGIIYIKSSTPLGYLVNSNKNKSPSYTQEDAQKWMDDNVKICLNAGSQHEKLCHIKHATSYLRKALLNDFNNRMSKHVHTDIIVSFLTDPNGISLIPEE
jgi:hypothetical protein